jgi:hypothetical protein
MHELKSNSRSHTRSKVSASSVPNLNVRGIPFFVYLRENRVTGDPALGSHQYKIGEIFALATRSGTICKLARKGLLRKGSVCLGCWQSLDVRFLRAGAPAMGCRAPHCERRAKEHYRSVGNFFSEQLANTWPDGLKATMSNMQENGQLTLKIYTHLVEDSHREAVEKLSSSLFPIVFIPEVTRSGHSSLIAKGDEFDHPITGARP